jgi:hypothetical protein
VAIRILARSANGIAVTLVKPCPLRGRNTRQLVDECAPDPATRHEILGQQRKRSYTLSHPIIGVVTIRDQRPLGLHNLKPALTDMTVEQWLDALNDRVFLWAHPQRLTRLL